MTKSFYETLSQGYGHKWHRVLVDKKPIFNKKKGNVTRALIQKE